MLNGGAAVLAFGGSDNGCVQPDRDLALRVAEISQFLVRRIQDPLVARLVDEPTSGEPLISMRTSLSMDANRAHPSRVRTLAPPMPAALQRRCNAASSPMAKYPSTMAAARSPASRSKIPASAEYPFVWAIGAQTATASRPRGATVNLFTRARQDAGASARWG